KYGDIEGRVMVKRFTGIAFPIIKEYNGIVIKTMGDGILASFENPLKASDCAIELQKSFYQDKQDKNDEVRTQIRIAMHFGKAVIDQEDVYGDVVNVAARVEKYTGPNQILISEPLYLKISNSNSYVCRSIGKFSFKGKSDSMALYRLSWYEGEELNPMEADEVPQKSIPQNIVLKKEFSTPQPEVIVSDTEYGKNPYMNRVMIRNSEDFFGRKKEISKIYSRIGSTRPQSVSVVGERRIGKSSLLSFIYNPTTRRQYLQEPDKYVFLFVDFQEKRGIDIPEFFATLYGCLIREFNNQLEIKLNPDYDGFRKIVQYLDGEGLKLIFVFDEFELITKNKNFGTEFYSYVRSLANNFNVAYLVSSGRNLQTMCHSREISDSPFFNIFSNIRLGQFNIEDATELISVPSKRSGYPLDAYVDTIIEFAGFYPFFIQMACAPFFEFLQQYGKLNKKIF
ncbi:MAG: adenylate/guanylate cyclase domain-containing protein, partial [Calditrichaceae bacterium]